MSLVNSCPPGTGYEPCYDSSSPTPSGFICDLAGGESMSKDAFCKWTDPYHQYPRETCAQVRGDNDQSDYGYCNGGGSGRRPVVGPSPTPVYHPLVPIHHPSGHPLVPIQPHVHHVPGPGGAGEELHCGDDPHPVESCPPGFVWQCVGKSGGISGAIIPTWECVPTAMRPLKPAKKHFVDSTEGKAIIWSAVGVGGAIIIILIILLAMGKL